MAYRDYANELMGYIPKLSFLLAQKAVNRAWRDIRDRRHWGFLIYEDVIIIPDMVATGSVAVTQFSTQVTANAAAKAVWDAMANPVITKRQFRSSMGPIYNIVAYDNVGGILTLDRKYLELTNAAAPYNIYQCYFEAPIADFKRYITVKDPITPRFFKLRWTKREIDRRDPQRQSQSQPYVIVQYKTNAVTGVPIHELWPQPITALGVETLIQRSGVDFVADADTLPPAIPEDLLMIRARQKAYEWAAANVGRYPELRGTSWQFLIGECEGQYQALGRRAEVNDEETFSQNFIAPEDSDEFIGPIDGKFMQSHDVWWS